MPNSWNAGKSCSAAHRSWYARDCHTVTTCRPSWSEPAAQASRPSMSAGALCLAETARKSSMVRPFDLLMWTYPMTVLPFFYLRVCAGRKDATGTRKSGHPGKYSAEYSFGERSQPRGDLAAVAEPELDQDVLDVVLRGPLGHEQGLADLLVGQPARDQLGHLDLARAQRGAARRPGR